MRLHSGHPRTFGSPDWVSGAPRGICGETQCWQKKTIQWLKLPPSPIEKVCLHFTHWYIGEGCPSGESL